MLHMKSPLNKSFFSIISISLLIFLWNTSCRKLSNDVSWDVDLKVPLIQSKLDVGDIFADSLIQINPDQSYSLVLRQAIAGIDNNELIIVHDTLSEDPIPIPLTTTISPGHKVIEKPSTYVMDLGDVQLKSARARNAEIKFLVRNSITQPLQIQYEVLSSDKNGSHFSILVDVPAADASGPSNFEKSIDLSDYTLDFTGPNHNSYNIVRSKTTMWIHPDADSAQVSVNDTIKVTSIFDHLEMDFASGYFSQFDELLTDSSTLNTFENFHSGTFDLENVKAGLNITNGLGVDMQLSLLGFQSINAKTNTTISLKDDLVGKKLNILRATETGSAQFPVIPQEYHFDLSQSNIAEMIENQPDALFYELQYKFNPLGNISGGNDFIYRDYTLEGNIELEIPLKLRMDSLQIRDYATINFDEMEKINSGQLVIYTKNLFPFDVSIQFFLLDDQLQIVDSLIPQNILSRAGTIDSQGFVISANEDRIVLPLSKEKLEAIKNTSQLLVRAIIQSQHSGNLRLYEHYHIDIKVVLEGSYAY